MILLEAQIIFWVRNMMQINDTFKDDPSSSSPRRNPLTSSTKFEQDRLGLVVWLFVVFSDYFYRTGSTWKCELFSFFGESHFFFIDSFCVDF